MVLGHTSDLGSYMLSSSEFPIRKTGLVDCSLVFEDSDGRIASQCSVLGFLEG